METTQTSEQTKSKWVIDTLHSQIGFKVKHLMFTNVRGYFREYDSNIVTESDDFLTPEIDFWINPASISTGDAKRDEHLRNSDFFDVEKYKEINFTGNTYEKVDDNGNYLLYGDLTMKGIKKQVKLQVEFGGVIKDPWGNVKAVFNVHGKINRKDWGVSWNAALETGGLLVSDEVEINCEVQLSKQPL
ncbi:YceI family protein [Fluviicola sp.]|uniref:YceI family protein n=1 Tax=Fluviicola sp. TaxID=1917219 RepID=UPI0031D3787A